LKGGVAKRKKNKSDRRLIHDARATAPPLLRKKKKNGGVIEDRAYRWGGKDHACDGEEKKEGGESFAFDVEKSGKGEGGSSRKALSTESSNPEKERNPSLSTFFLIL